MIFAIKEWQYNSFSQFWGVFARFVVSIIL